MGGGHIGGHRGGHRGACTGDIHGMSICPPTTDQKTRARLLCYGNVVRFI